MITYSRYREGNTNIKFAENETLVLGFIIETANDLQRRFALHPNGLCKMTDYIARTDDGMNNSAVKWSETYEADAIPLHAEFIGHYKPTMF